MISFPSLAGCDYEHLQPAVLTYSSSSSRTQMFPINITNDDLIEPRESFETVLNVTRASVSRVNGRSQPFLSQQERDRIQVQILRGQVFILDTKS